MAKQLSLNYSLNTGSQWVYCNFPEVLPTDAYGDSGYGSHCLNRQTVTGTGQIFYSYNTANLTADCHFGIRVYNPGTTSITFKRSNYGHSDSLKDGAWNQVPIKSWQRFFQSTATTYTIPAKGTVWICDEVIPKGRIFSGNLRYNTSGSAIVAVYIYKTKANIAASTPIYPYDKVSHGPSQYSGYGNGYFFTASEITIKLSDIVNNGGVYFETNYRKNSNYTVNDSTTTDEMIPINIAGTSYVAKNGAASPLGNVANWSAQYFFPIKIVNDLGGTRQVKCYIESGTNSEKYPIINCGGAVTSQKINGTSDPWLWKTISVTDTATFNYQFILGTNSTEYIKHMFKV